MGVRELAGTHHIVLNTIWTHKQREKHTAESCTFRQLHLKACWEGSLSRVTNSRVCLNSNNVWMISSSEVGQLATFPIESMEAFVWISRGLWVEFQRIFWTKYERIMLIVMWHYVCSHALWNQCFIVGCTVQTRRYRHHPEYMTQVPLSVQV